MATGEKILRSLIFVGLHLSLDQSGYAKKTKKKTKFILLCILAESVAHGSDGAWRKEASDRLVSN
jgi:hypothetical protein